MTYTEWRDELKSNLLSVPEDERRRVLDYYAEAYADRREAGFSERDIIADFGAPYDAAQKILHENQDAPTQSAPRPQYQQNYQSNYQQNYQAPPAPQPVPPAPQPAPQSAARKQKSYGWVFVILCIIFAIPLFGLIMGMVGITIGFCVAPFALIVSGAIRGGASIGVMISGDVTYGLIMLGEGFIALGAGVLLMPLFGKLVKLMWKLFNKVFSAIKSLFYPKERAV